MADSLINTGTATAPAAGAAIATIAAPGAGTYYIQVFVAFGGTADVFNNMQLQHGAVVVGTLYTQGATANGFPTRHVFNRITIAAAEAITVNAIAAGAVGSVYQATIIATRIF
jgi:hypothetical protein